MSDVSVNVSRVACVWSLRGVVCSVFHVCSLSFYFYVEGARRQNTDTTLYDMPTMILLIGMNISFTKKPMKPMIAKPTDVACAIFENSAGRDTNRARRRWHARAPSQQLH